MLERCLAGRQTCRLLPVYHDTCLVRFITKKTKEAGQVPRGRPINVAAVDAFNRLCDYLETSCDQKVYTLKELHEQMTCLSGPGAQIYEMRSLKIKLEERYGSNIFMVGQAARPGLFCFKGFAECVLSDKWCTEQSDAEMNMAEKHVKRCARLIAAEIREMPYTMKE